MKRKIFVLARNFRQFNDFLEDTGYSSKDFVYAPRPDSFRGVHSVSVLMLDGWRNNKSIETLMDFQNNIEIANE